MIKVISTPVWSDFISKNKLKGKRKACIAYVTGTSLPLSKGDVLLCDASERAIGTGMTSAKALKYYFEKGVLIYSNGGLHAKFIVSDNLILVGSANYSENSSKMLEAALLTDDISAISQGVGLSLILLEHEDTEIIDRKRLSELLNVKVVRTPWLKGKSFQKLPKLGETCWYLRCIPLSERSYSNFNERHEKAKGELSRKYSLDEEDVHMLRWGSKAVFAKNCKVGDLLIIRWSEKGSRKSVIYPPSTVLGIDYEGKYTLIYHDGTNTEERKMAYSKFKNELKVLSITKGYNARIMKVPESDLNNIQRIWR
jgi:phosphatidylserine/phosphatidylglycerophosphate/cardiolipin synthase-like enzyme